jgi:hypothetical protein
MWSKGTQGEGSREMELAPTLQIYKNPYWSTCCYHTNMHDLIIHNTICGHVRFKLLCALKNGITTVQTIPCLSSKTGTWLPITSVSYYTLFQSNITQVTWRDIKTTKPSKKFQTFVLNTFIKLFLSYYLQQQQQQQQWDKKQCFKNIFSPYHQVQWWGQTGIWNVDF